MEEKLFTVKDEIEINASKEKVWELLTNPDFIKLWDDIPENYTGENLQINSVLDWVGYSKLTVTGFDKYHSLKMNLYLPKVDLDPSEYDANYVYSLAGDGNKTILTITVGDFAALPNAQDYVDSSFEFVKAATKKIKQLAEE